MPLRTVDATTPADDLVAFLNTDRAVIVDGLATADELAAIGAERSPWLDLPIDQSPLGTDKSKGMRTLRTSSLIAKSPGCRRPSMTPRVLEVLDRVWGPRTRPTRSHGPRRSASAPARSPRCPTATRTCTRSRAPGPSASSTRSGR